MSGNIVVEWLRSLHLGQYAESFLDNGYDDLEICKQVGDPDLDAIGVFNPTHRGRLLASVRTLREEGAASVYFTLEETVATTTALVGKEPPDDCSCGGGGGDAVSRASDKSSSAGAAGASPGAASSSAGSASGSGSAELCSIGASGVARYADEYEEGKAELVRFPRMQLKMLLRERVAQDGVRLSAQPYSTTSGERGYLEGLASRYADLFRTHYGDVLDHLEELRRREWAEMSPRMRVLPSAGSPADIAGTPNAAQSSGLTSSQSQPLYVPGKYSPSSCLSDKEEDEIYGFGYGVFGRHIAQAQRRAQQAHLLQQAQAAGVQGTTSCLSPRSAYFYEFPPAEQQQGPQRGNATSTKKKGSSVSLARLLRGLRTVHRKEKPRHRNAHGRLVRAGTPDSLGECGPHEYERVRVLQVNGGASPSFEETIHRLKVQDALRKRERFHQEHEQLLRDLRRGLLHLRPTGARDDTYMYDEDARVVTGAAAAAGGPTHWYDEPPYESDPEDFLMGGQPGPQATIQNGRVCFTLNLRPEARGEGVISLQSAGDISLPRDGSGGGSGGEGCGSGGSGGGRAARRGLLLPPAGAFPGAIIPLGRGDRESGDYASSDVQSVGSRLSTMSIETSRSEQPDISSPSYLPSATGGGFRRLQRRRGSDGASPGHSSGDDGDPHTVHPQVTVHATESGAVPTGLLVGKQRAPRQDPGGGGGRQRRGARRTGETSTEAFPSASSAESLPSGSGSSTQALVPASSPHGSLSAEEAPLSAAAHAHGPVLCRARALVDYTPSPYDKDALRLRKGDVVDVLAMPPSGLWRGAVGSRVGVFKFINVELLGDRHRHNHGNHTSHATRRGARVRGQPSSVEELLQRISLEEHTSLFVLNGYEDLDLFQEIEATDLDYLGIRDPEHRAKILTAVELLHECGSPDSRCEESEADEAAGTSTGPDEDDDEEGDDDDECLERASDPGVRTAGSRQSPSAFRRLHFPRDSGCYEAPSPRHHHHQHHHHHHHHHKKGGGGGGHVRSCGGRALRDQPNNLQCPGGAGKSGSLPPGLGAGTAAAAVAGGVTAQRAGGDGSRVGSRQGSVELLLSSTQAPAYQPNILPSPNGGPPPPAPVSGQPVSAAAAAASLGGRRCARLDSDVPGLMEDSCETDAKLTMVKFVVGGGSDLGLGCESANSTSRGSGGGCCFSEKSSDSGISSSSLSSAHVRRGGGGGSNNGGSGGGGGGPTSSGGGAATSPTIGGFPIQVAPLQVGPDSGEGGYP